jgi:hypothetical protein
MPDNPRRFAVCLALVVTPVEEGRVAVPDLQEELEARSYLGSPRVRWDEAAQHVIIEVLDTNLDAEQAGATMTEELFEVASAVLSDFDTLRVEILDVTLV